MKVIKIIKKYERRAIIRLGRVINRLPYKTKLYMVLAGALFLGLMSIYTIGAVIYEFGRQEGRQFQVRHIESKMLLNDNKSDSTENKNVGYGREGK